MTQPKSSTTPSAANGRVSINRQPVKSSNLKTIGYDAGTGTLEVEFANGNLYRYHGVPADKHAALMAAPSAGSFFHANIRGAHTAEKVDA